MERQPTRMLTAIVPSLLAFALITPWALGQDPDRVTGIQRLAEQGDAEVQFILGVMYSQGRGVPENDAEAVRGFRPAAEQGYARAQHNLGLMYANGEGVPQDDVLAYAWLNLAVAQGNPLASANKDQLQTRMTTHQVVRAQELSAILFDRIF